MRFYFGLSAPIYLVAGTRIPTKRMPSAEYLYTAEGTDSRPIEEKPYSVSSQGLVTLPRTTSSS